MRRHQETLLVVIVLSTAATLLVGSVGAYTTATNTARRSVGAAGSAANNVVDSVVAPTSATAAPNTTPNSRRSLLSTGLLTAAGLLAAAPRVAQGAVASAPLLESVYFGVGCFWHLQKELVEAERTLLGRSDAELTSLTGYAGGKAVGSEGRVCYHNLRSIADYGKLGHGEVVGLQLPQDKIVEFSRVYFSLFDPKTGGTCWLSFLCVESVWRCLHILSFFLTLFFIFHLPHY